MNLKILVAILIYYSILGLTFALGSPYLTGATNTINLNDSALTANETGTGGVFSNGISFARFAAFMSFGVGLDPVTTPGFVQVFFMVWQTGVTIFTAAFIISSIWNG